jgi:type II secretory pathway pseudopilin PulG
MNKGLIAIISFFLTAFILVVGVSAVNAASSLQAAKQAAEAQNSSTSSNEELLLQQMNEREAAYQQLIAEANARIETLNNQMVSASQQSDSPESSAVEEQPNINLIGPDDAANIALATVNNEDTLTHLPELVNYEGNQAYEIKMTGGVLYIDAITGDVLINTVPARINGTRAAEIAGTYLGGMDPKYAVVSIAVLNGTEIYKVVFNNYVVYVDPYGQILGAQVYQYVDNSNDGSNNGASSSSTNYDDDDDDHEEEDND